MPNNRVANGKYQNLSSHFILNLKERPPVEDGEMGLAYSYGGNQRREFTRLASVLIKNLLECYFCRGDR